MSAAPFANGIVPQPVAYTRPGEEVDLSIDNELPARATIVLQNNQILHLQCVQVILTLIKRWDIDIPLTAIEHVTLSAEGKGLLRNKYQAVLYFHDNSKRYTLDGKGQGSVAIMTNVSAYANAPLTRV